MKAIAVRLLIAGLMLGVVLLGFWATRPGGPFVAHNIRNAFTEIKSGMSVWEVEKVIRVPPGCYDGAVLEKDEKSLPKLHEQNTQHTWVIPSLLLIVEFDRGEARQWMAHARDQQFKNPGLPKRRWWGLVD